MQPVPQGAAAYPATASRMICPGVAGDIVAVQRNHCVHYVVNVGGNFVIHRTNPKVDRVGAPAAGDAQLPGAMVVKELFSEYARPGERWWVNNVCDHQFAVLPSAEVVARAHSKLGERGYSVVSQNCEHFATWCRYDRAVSSQVDNVLDTVATDAGTEAVARGAQFGAVGGRVGAAVGSGTGRVIGGIIGAVVDRREADEAVRTGGVMSGRCRQAEWAENGRAMGEKGVGLVGAVGAAAVGGLVGLIGGGAKGVAKVANQHNVTRQNAPSIAAEVVRGTE